MKRGWLLVALLVLAIGLGQGVGLGQTLTPVTWIGMVGATANGNTLQNVAGIGSGSVSQQHLSSGDGFVQVTMTDPTMDYVVSLGNVNVTGFVGGWALHVAMYGAEVREGNWGLMANTLIKTGDVFSIAVVNGQVVYMKNDKVFYTSLNGPTYQYPLEVLASLWSFGATVSNANLSSTFARVPMPMPRLSAVNPRTLPLNHITLGPASP